MATTDLKFWDGSAWVSVGSVAGDLIRLPVAAADGESQVNGADGLISIENTTPGGEAGMTFVTANDGTRWKVNVEEGLVAGQMTFYNAANEPVFTMRQNGDVYLEQGGPDNSGGIAATEDFVRTLMNTFPLIDDGNNTQSSWARIDTDNDGPNVKEIYFGIGGQSVQNPDRILTISIDTNADPDKQHITAHEDYTPTDPQDLVTLSYFQANSAGSLPISSVDETVTIDGENNKVSVYGNSALPDITPIVLEIKTTANGSGWSTEDAWGRLSFWNDDLSSGGAKQHAFIDCVASTQTGGLSNMRFGTLDDTWMTMKPSGLINFTPQEGNGSAAEEGDIFYDSRYELFRYWDGEQWQDINPQGSGNGYFWNSRGEGVCPGAGISEESPVIPVNIGSKFSSNNYMLNDGAIYTITLGTSSTGSIASSKYVVRKVDGLFTAEIMSSNSLVSNVPIISVRPTTQIDPDTGLPYEDRHEVVLWDNHEGNYVHTWNIEAMITGSVQQQFSVNNPWYTIGPSIFQSDNVSYVCLDAINSKQQAVQDVAWSYSSGSFNGKWADPEDTGVITRVTYNTWNSNAANAMYPRSDGEYGRWYERPRIGMRLTNSGTNTKFESATNAYDGNFYSFNGDPATWQGGLIQAVEWDGDGTNVENVTKIRMSARDKNEKDMCHSRTYVSPAYLEDPTNTNGNDWMQIWITQDDGSKLSSAYMVTSGQYVSPSADDPIDSQPYYEYGVKWYGSGTSIGTDFNGGQDGVAYQIQFFRNMTGMVISENGNTQLTRLSLDFNHADGQFYRDATARLAAERKGGTAEIQLCGYSQINGTIGLHKNFECGYYGFKIFAAQEQVAKIDNTGANFAGSLTTSTLLVTTDSSTCAVITSTTQSSQIKCVSASGTTWHGIANGKWCVDYYRTGTTTYTEGLRLDLNDGRVTSKGGIGTDTITTKNGSINDVITYLANDELRVNTAIEKPSAPGTYGRSNTFTVEPNAVKVLANINTGDAALASADLVIGYDSTVGSTTPFGLLQWQAWDNTSDKNMISFCEIGIDPVDGAGRGNGGELVFKTKEANIDGTTERLRITKNDIKAQAGYEPQTDDSLVTKGWIQTNGASVNRIDPTLFSDQINSSSAMYHDNSATMQMQNDSQTTGAYASYNFWVRNDTNVSQQSAFSFVSTDSGYAGEFAWTIRSSGSQQYEAMRLTSWALITPGILQTDTITSKDAASPSGGVSGDATIDLGSHITFNANAAGTAEDLVAVFSSFTSKQRGLQVKNGINGNRQNAHVILDAKSDGDLGKMTFQTDGTDVFWIGKDNNGDPVDIKAFDGYEPQTDDSLITKKYCDDEISQAIASGGGDTTVEIGTPTSETEPDDAPGSMKIDEDFLWVKTNTAWKKLSLAAFDDNATSVTVQLTQSAFNAIASPDPNVLYVIVGD